MSFQRIRTQVEKKQKRRKERGSRSMQKRQAFGNRRAQRGNDLGRQTEERVEKLLAKKLAEGELVSFLKHQPNSAEDQDGKDFTVSQKIDGVAATASFGITISHNLHTEKQAEHPNVPLILVPVNMTDERIWYRICQILKEAKEARA